MFWVIAGLMAAGALALILRTLTARHPVEREAGTEEVEVYRAQLAELERDVASGMVPAEDAEASRAELERRLLQADERRRQAEAAPEAIPAEAARRRMATVIAVMMVPVAAAFLYLALGNPGGPGTAGSPGQAGAVPGAAQGAQGAQGAQAMQGETAEGLDVLAERLAERLKESPEDARGWGLLGRSYSVLGQYEKAAGAYRKAVALRPDVAELQSGLGEALALSSEGKVTPEALQAFTRAHALDSSDAAARFYLGMADYQNGKFREALDAWVALAKDAPADAPWLADLHRQIGAVARQLGEDPEKLLAQAPKPTSPPAGPATAPAATAPAGRRGPTGEDMQAASELSEEDRQAMVRDMVTGLEARLEQNPDDPQGWRMLARSYRVLGDPEKSAGAFGHLAELRPEDAAIQGEYAMALVQRDQAKGAEFSEETVTALRNVLRLDESNTEARFYLGKAEAERGNRAQAETHLRRLIAQLPEGAPLRKQAEALLNAGPAGSD